jgi:hypothetical protein
MWGGMLQCISNFIQIKFFRNIKLSFSGDIYMDGEF